MTVSNRLNLSLNDENNQFGEIAAGYTIDTDNDFEDVVNNLHIKVAYPGDTFDFSGVPTESVERLKKLPKELKKDFLKYLKSKEKTTIVGDQWSFLKVGEEYYAYGANIVLEDESKRKNALSELIDALEKETKGSKKLLYISLLIISLALTGWVVVKNVPSVQSFFSKVVEKAQEPKSIVFLKKQFINISKWRETGTKEQKELADVVFDKRKVDSIWRHVTSDSWNSGLSKEEKRSAQARFILFDLINYNDDIRKQCDKRKLIKGTRFESICEIYKPAYKSTIFYWKTGVVEKLTNIEEIKNLFEQYNMPISNKDYQYCFDDRIAVVEMDGMDEVSLKIPKSRKNDLPSEWVAAVIQDTSSSSNMKWHSIVLFKLGVPTNLSSDSAELIKPTGDTSKKTSLVVRWVSLPQTIINSLGLTDKEKSKEYSIIEKSTVFLDMFGKILNDNFLEENEKIISAEKARDMLITVASSSDINCSKSAKDSDRQRHLSAIKNEDGSYGVGLSTKDPIKASLMNNILNKITMPGLKHEISELHESHISVSRNDGTGGSQERIVISKEIKDKFKEAEAFSIYENGSEVVKYINVEGGESGVHDYAYSFNGDMYVSVSIISKWKEGMLIMVSGIKARYKTNALGGRIDPVTVE